MLLIQNFVKILLHRLVGVIKNICHTTIHEIILGGTTETFVFIKFK